MALALVALTVAAATVRFAGLDAQSYWGDEALTVGEIRVPSFGGTLGLVLGQETTPPLYFVLAWGWAKVFGAGEAGLRSLSAVAGTALVPVAYATGARLFTRRAGLAAAALVVANPFLVWYSQEARAYALFILLGGLSFLCFAAALRDRHHGWLLGWAVASSLALTSHFFAAFLVGPEVLWLLIAAPCWGTTAAVGSVALVGATLLPVAIVDRAHGTTWIGHTPLVHRVATTAGQFALGRAAQWSWLGGWLMVLAGGIAVALAAVPCLLRGRERRSAMLAGVIGGLVLGIPVALAAGGADYLDPRNVAVAWLPLALVIAAGLGSPRAGRAGVGGAAVLCLCSLGATIATSLRGDLQRPDWRAVAADIGPVRFPRMVVADASGAEPLRLYLPRVVRDDRTAVAVAEIALVRHIPRAGPLAGCRRLPCLPALPPVPVEGARRLLPRRARVGDYAVARWWLPRPIRITAGSLRRSAIRSLDPRGAGRVVVVAEVPRSGPRDAGGRRGSDAR